MQGLPMPDMLQEGRDWIADDLEFVRQLLQVTRGPPPPWLRAPCRTSSSEHPSHLPQGPNPASIVTASEVPGTMDAAYIDRQLSTAGVRVPYAPSSRPPPRVWVFAGVTRATLPARSSARAGR